MLLRREASFLCLADVVRDTLTHERSNFRKALYELRCMTCSESQHILIYEHLTVTAAACTDTDSGNEQFLCDNIRQLSGDTLQDYCTGTCLLYLKGIGDELSCLVKALALYLEAAEGID